MMKNKILCWLGGFFFCLCSCHEVDYQMFDEPAAVQFGKANEERNYTFVYRTSDILKDTVYLRVYLAGKPTGEPRYFRLRQVPVVKWDYLYDKFGIVVDSVQVETRQAKENIHYLPLPEEVLCIASDSVGCSIPVILLRDTSLQNHEYHLSLRLEGMGDLKQGEFSCLESVIVLSDVLQKPSNWNEVLDVYIGRYSRTKHRLLIDVSGMIWDEKVIESEFGGDVASWFYWQAVLWEAIEDYKLEHGKPLMDENNKEVTCPKF